MAEPAAVATAAPTTPIELPGGAYFKGDEADAEWLLIGAILVFFMRASLARRFSRAARSHKTPARAEAGRQPAGMPHTRQQHFRLRCSRREAKGEPGS